MEVWWPRKILPSRGTQACNNTQRVCISPPPPPPKLTKAIGKAMMPTKKPNSLGRILASSSSSSSSSSRRLRIIRVQDAPGLAPLEDPTARGHGFLMGKKFDTPRTLSHQAPLCPRDRFLRGPLFQPPPTPNRR